MVKIKLKTCKSARKVRREFQKWLRACIILQQINSDSGTNRQCQALSALSPPLLLSPQTKVKPRQVRLEEGSIDSLLRGTTVIQSALFKNEVILVHFYLRVLFEV